MKIKRSFLVVLFLAGFALAQVPVLLSPIPRFQQFDQSGRPLSFGCVFTYQNNSTTPLPTYTDQSGSTQNANPVVLSAGGSASIWIQSGLAYTYVVKSFGGINCVAGSTVATVNGVGGGASTLASIVPWSAAPVFFIQAQTQLFSITLTGNSIAQPFTAFGITVPALVTVQVTQDSGGNHVFTWPSNSVGAAPVGVGANQVTTQTFIWNGASGTAIGPPSQVISTGVPFAVSGPSVTTTGQVVNIPAGFASVGGVFRISAGVRCTGASGAAAPTISLVIGSTIIQSQQIKATTDYVKFAVDVLVVSTSAANTYGFSSGVLSGSNIYTPSFFAVTQNLTSAFTVFNEITGTLNSTGSFTFDYITVEPVSAF